MSTPFHQALARRHLADLGALLVPAYERPLHVERLCQALEAVERGEIKRLLVTAPPRHGKSIHVARLLPAWYLGKHPDREIILASHGAELSTGHSRAARAFMRHPSYPFPDVTLSEDSHAAGRWNTNHGGSLRATGVKGAVTGHGAHLLLLDDLLSGVEAASSEQVRETTWAWLVNDALSRLMPGGAIVAIGTRWHLGDPLGRLLDGPGGDEWTVLRFPALAEEDDLLDREPGEALWPTWYDEDYHAARKVELGARNFAAMHQGSPTSAEGNLFKREAMSGRYETAPEEMRIVAGVDASYGEGVASDFSAIVTVGLAGPHFYVLDCVRGRWSLNELRRRIEQAHEKWNPSAVLVEDTGAGRSAAQVLSDESPLPVVRVSHEGASKAARSEAVTGLFEAGRVLFPAHDPGWRDDLIEELCGFPAAKHDDMVDATVYALARLRGGKSHGAVAGAVTHGRQGMIVSRRGRDGEQTRTVRPHGAGRQDRARERARERVRKEPHPRLADD